MSTDISDYVSNELMEWGFYIPRLVCFNPPIIQAFLPRYSYLLMHLLMSRRRKFGLSSQTKQHVLRHCDGAKGFTDRHQKKASVAVVAH